MSTALICRETALSVAERRALTAQSLREPIYYEGRQRMPLRFVWCGASDARGQL
jgi:hypothetical protein